MSKLGNEGDLFPGEELARANTNMEVEEDHKVINWDGEETNLKTKELLVSEKKDIGIAPSNGGKATVIARVTGFNFVSEDMKKENSPESAMTDNEVKKRGEESLSTEWESWRTGESDRFWYRNQRTGVSCWERPTTTKKIAFKGYRSFKLLRVE